MLKMVINLDYEMTLQEEMYLRKKFEKKNIRRVSNAAGLGVIGFVFIQLVLSVVIILPPLGNFYIENLTFQSAANVFLSVFGMLIPFAIAGIYLEKKTYTDVFKFNKPVSIPLMLSAVPFGFLVCLVGNYLTNLFVGAMDSIGITLTSPEFQTPSDISGRIIYAISVAVVPPLVEEFALRGAVMQPLRKYGRWFAIVASALVFAVLHGNFIQAPFALIAGIGIGYAVSVTDCIWTGVLIHFCNNFYAVVTEFMVADIPDEARLNKVYYMVQIVLYAVSVAGTIVFILIRRKHRQPKVKTVRSGFGRMMIFVGTVPMIFALLIMFVMTFNYISFDFLK